jgi:hypothetical protein
MSDNPTPMSAIDAAATARIAKMINNIFGETPRESEEQEETFVLDLLEILTPLNDRECRENVDLLLEGDLHPEINGLLLYSSVTYNTLVSVIDLLQAIPGDQVSRHLLLATLAKAAEEFSLVSAEVLNDLVDHYSPERRVAKKS